MRRKPKRPGGIEVLHGGGAKMIEHQRVSRADAGLLIPKELAQGAFARRGRKGNRETWAEVVLLRGPEIWRVVVAAVQVEGDFPGIVCRTATVGLRDAGIVILGQRVRPA